MKIGIIAAMPQELKILVEALENGEKHLRLGKVYYTGSIGRHEVVLVESGIGKVMSAMSVAVLANDFKVEAIINTGSAGAVAPGMAVGDIVLADKLAYHDVDVTLAIWSNRSNLAISAISLCSSSWKCQPLVLQVLGKVYYTGCTGKKCSRLGQ